LYQLKGHYIIMFSWKIKFRFCRRLYL